MQVAVAEDCGWFEAWTEVEMLSQPAIQKNLLIAHAFVSMARQKRRWCARHDSRNDQIDRRYQKSCAMAFVV